MTDLTLSASNIIKRSILSSIYVDDQIIEPFGAIDENDIRFTTAKGMYDSFRQEGKSIDFYRFDQQRPWQNDCDFIFKNRDLLVIDWQLIGDDLDQPETLEMISKATECDSLHFISIYTTAQPNRDFPQIFYQIKAYFNSAFSKTSFEHAQAIVTTLNDEGVDTSFFAGMKGRFKELALRAGDTRQEVFKQLGDDIQSELGRNYGVFMKGLRTISQDRSTACEVFGYYLNELSTYSETEATNEVRIDFIDEHFIVVNHTIIQINNKKQPEPKDLFQSFTSALQKVSGNLLTLITLEIRSLLRESSGFIGKDADSIGDAVLFHQQQKKSGFMEFLMSIVKSHTISYFDYKQASLTSMKDDFWSEYLKEKNIQPLVDKLEEAEQKGALVKELIKLNVYYNVLHVKRSEGDIVKFGDVFKDAGSGNFYMCITAHCDCLQPQNIKNNFYFISGLGESPEKLVAEGDDTHCSYIRSDNGIVAINWNPKPIVFKISDNKLKNQIVNGVDGLEGKYELTYFSTIKENYAQRMANKAFSHTMRVGINFAKM